MDEEDNYISIRNKILDWYNENKRDFPWRKSKNLYQILITEILLQKTIALNVSNVYNDFFTKYKGFADIFKADISQLQSDIEILGLSNKRAKTLKDLSAMVLTEYNGEIPLDPEMLRKINGIADYVSNAFLCFGLDKRTFFLDVNIKRFVSRVFESSNSKVINDVLHSNLDRLLPKTGCKHMYWAILDFGNKICSKKNPKCEFCPISENCLYYQNL